MQTEAAAKRKIKDSVFSALFSERKYLAELCRVLKPDVTEDELENLSLVTIQNVLVDDLYNDLAFTIGDVLMILVEAQSTWTENILVRILMYYAKEIQEEIAKKKLNVYSRKKIKIPKPMFYVVYTGKEDHPEDLLSLAEEFFGGDASALEVKVQVLRAGNDGNILDQYIGFTRICDEQTAKYGRTREAVMRAIKICVERNILKEFLVSRETEVIDMMDTLFNEEQLLEAYGEEKYNVGKSEGIKEGRSEGLREGRSEGLREGRSEGIVETVKNIMKSLGLTAEKALSLSGVPEREWKNYLPQLG